MRFFLFTILCDSPKSTKKNPDKDPQILFYILPFVILGYYGNSFKPETYGEISKNRLWNKL